MADLVDRLACPRGPIPLAARGLAAVLARVGPRGLRVAATAGDALSAYATALGGRFHLVYLADRLRCDDSCKTGFAARWLLASHGHRCDEVDGQHDMVTGTSRPTTDNT